MTDLVAVIRDRYQPAGCGEPVRLAEALLRRWATDAHWQPGGYTCRASAASEQPDAGAYFAIDVDVPEGARLAHPYRWDPARRQWRGWRARARRQWSRLPWTCSHDPRLPPTTRSIALDRCPCPRPFCYETAHGWRAIWRLEGRQRWRTWVESYLQAMQTVARVSGIIPDEACADPGRIFRLPFVVRDGVAQERAIDGDPENIAVWPYAWAGGAA